MSQESSLPQAANADHAHHGSCVAGGVPLDQARMNTPEGKLIFLPSKSSRTTRYSQA